MSLKILVLDIETSPTKAWVWKGWKENVHPDQIIEPGQTICIGAKWVGCKEKFLFSNWEHGHKKMLKLIHQMISESDAVVTFNGEDFDLATLNGEFIKYGFPPTPPITSIDLIKTVRKLRFFSNRLMFLGPHLGVGGKVKHEGFELWTKVLAGDEAAIKRMSRYCLKDVVLTERLYKKLRPYITNHPYLSTTPRTSCGACQSKQLQSRGYRRTKSFIIQRIHCQGCGAWQDGTREKVK